MSEKQVREPHAFYTVTAEEADMPVAKMTALELKTLIRDALKEALQELLGDPDTGLELRPEFEERLREADSYVASGGRLLSLVELTGQLEGVSDV